MNVMTVGLRTVLGALLLTGCFPHPSEKYACENGNSDTCEDGRSCVNGYCVIASGSGGSDGGSSDAEDSCTNFSARHFMACSIPKPTGPMALTTANTYIYNTTDGTLSDPSGNTSMPTSMMVAEGRLVSVESFTVASGATLRVNGMYPLIVASWGTIEISGLVDLASTTAPALIGAGANPAGCAAHAATIGQNNNGGGGGGGGSMQSAGGNGGDGNDGNGNNGGTGGTAVPAPLLAGGCSGAKGGDDGTVGGVGGVGGGAIQLTARVSIVVAATGRVHAGGAGGKQALGAQGGGGGGGAGGMIGLEAPSVTLTSGAILAANGGAGGQGGGNNGGQPGPGQDAKILPIPTAALGGRTGSGGFGGDGSIVATYSAATMDGDTDGAGGGGGGGAAGFIAIKAGTRMDAGAILSPAPTTIP